MVGESGWLHLVAKAQHILFKGHRFGNAAQSQHITAAQFIGRQGGCSVKQRGKCAIHNGGKIEALKG